MFSGPGWTEDVAPAPERGEVIATYAPCCGTVRRGIIPPGQMHSGLCCKRAGHNGKLGPTILLTAGDLVEEEKPVALRKFIAVVVAPDRPSRRNEGSWSCFVADTKSEAIEKALAAREHWGTERYEIHVGQIDERVVIPTNYKLEKLSAGA